MDQKVDDEMLSLSLNVPVSSFTIMFSRRFPKLCKLIFN